MQENQNETEPRLHFTGQENLLVHYMKSLASLPGKEDWKREKKKQQIKWTQCPFQIWIEKLIGTVLNNFWLARVDCMDF